MGSEIDAEAAGNTSAVDSDGSVSWEDFFGTSTDLVPQLLGMFDELARRGGNGCRDYHHHSHVVLPSSCGIPAALQKRLSLVQHSQHRGSIFGQLCTVNQDKPSNHHYHGHQEVTMSEEVPAQDVQKNESSSEDASVEKSGSSAYATFDISAESKECSKDEDVDEKPNYRRESSGLTPLRYNRRCRQGGRPLSGSSIASSTSSSGCSNQGSPGTTNLYLASVESLADTCASSQGSGDSGVITISEASCRIANSTNGQRRDSTEGDSLCNRPRYCDPHRNPVERVLLEIVDTEAIYVEHLRQVIQGYLIFWRDHPTSFVHQLQLSDLFSNIENIFEFNREFLKEIEKCSLDPVCVANTFIKHNSGFKVYTEYCTNYPRTVSVLTDLMGQEKTATAFRERQAALGHALPLGSFLLKPVQRILKYHLLLENLSKEYGADCETREKETEGRGAIEAALAAMTGIAKHINAMKRRHEHAVRVQEIQSLLYGWPGPDLTTSGELVAEGRFRIRGAKAPRHAFLFDRMLLLTKKKEDGLLVYKAHIMCSNLMLIESIPGDPLSFHVIPFDNPRLQYTLQARNLEQKREWTLQIKRVILENYNAVIPSHARQLVLQLGQTHSEDDTVDKGSTKKQHSAPPEYLERRKQERERRRSETGLRQKFKKNSRKFEANTTVPDASDSSASPRKNRSEDPSIDNSKEQSTLNRSSDGRTSKVKDRFAGWRRKSEPGFQSYVCLNQSDDELQKVFHNDRESAALKMECMTDEMEVENSSVTNSVLSEAKENNDQQVQQAQTVEEIVGHILMQNQEFQKLLEKQRTNSIINVRQQQRFNKHLATDTSDESDSENTNYPEESNNSNKNSNSNHGGNNQSSGSSNNSNNNKDRVRLLREQRLLRTNNTWNTLSSVGNRENQPSLQLLYDNLKTGKPAESASKNRVNRVQEKKALFEAFKRQSIVTESKIIKTALRIRENSNVRVDDNVVQSFAQTSEHGVVEKQTNLMQKDRIDGEEATEELRSFGNYDNLQHVWEGFQDQKDIDSNDSPTRPAVWLTKLCEGLPLSPQKCGSLPRSFQINPNSHQQVNLTKSRFLQRDGKPMNERPFTIASDKPAEINLEDMERYASTCQPEGRIAKFPTSSSSSTFFYSLDDALTDAYSEIHISTNANIHPDHKVYRANRNTGNASSPSTFKNVLLKAGCRLQVLRNTASTETLACTEELERAKYFRSLSSGKLRRKSKTKRESSSDIEELLGCVASGTDSKSSPLYYKQGSSGLGARIAQSDYADPSVLFSEKKVSQFSDSDAKISDSVEDQVLTQEHRESETDSFYEKSFETIENYVDADIDETFRDSAIFSDADEVLFVRPKSSFKEVSSVKSVKVAPPVPAKRRQEFLKASDAPASHHEKCKPSVAQKPDFLKTKSLKKAQDSSNKSFVRSSVSDCTASHEALNDYDTQQSNAADGDREDVSIGQSQAGWVKKIVGQFQGQIET